jgi:hypothetical protein
MTVEKLWTKVDKSGECWIWTGAKNQKGYGNLVFEGEYARPHRVVYEHEIGPIPPGMHVLHRCDNPSCVNPEHLFLGTNLDNRHDMFAKGRHPHGPTHGNAKLSWGAVHEARVRNVLGESASALAREFGVSAVQMQRVVGGRSYLEDRVA